MRLRWAVCSVAVGLLCSAYGDDIILNDGTTVTAEVYRESDTEILYIDPAKDCCCTIATKLVKEVKHTVEPVVDIKAFLARSAKKISHQQKADLEKYLELVRDFKTRALRNTKVVVHEDEDAPELVVDPFPDEDKASAKAKPAQKQDVKKANGDRPKEKGKEEKTKEPAKEEVRDENAPATEEN